jgi:hypothetical protein
MGMNLPKVLARPEFSRRCDWYGSSRASVRIVVMICAVAFVACTGASDNERFLWKAVGRAQLKLEDKTPLTWNVYQTEKKKQTNLVLVQLGRRYLALDIKGKVAYYVFPFDLQAKGSDFESGDLFVQSRVMPTTAWTVRDVGPAEMIKLTLGDYGRALDVELPHMPDLRAFY